jgi:hypothetical protein
MLADSGRSRMAEIYTIQNFQHPEKQTFNVKLTGGAFLRQLS